MGISFRTFRASTSKQMDQPRRARTKAALSCDSLEGRQLLATLPVLPFSTPSTAVVATATNILQEKAPTAFAKYESDLAKAESTSRVSLAYENAISLNETQLDSAIESSGQSANAISAAVNHVQDIIDGAFTGTVYTSGLKADLEGTFASPQLVKLTISNMDAIAKQSCVSAKMKVTLAADMKAIGTILGPNPDTNLGAGAADRDPLTVYYDGQAGKFVR
jgi:hypothetical protein